MTIVLDFRLFRGLNDNQAKALFWVGMYRLDRGNKEFEEDRRMFRAREKGFRLTGRTGFDRSLLALPALADWKLEAYRVRAASGPGCGIYHVHQGTKHAAIVRYSLPSAGIADYRRFHELNERLPFTRNQWTIQRDYIVIGPKDSGTESARKSRRPSPARGSI